MLPASPTKLTLPPLLNDGIAEANIDPSDLFMYPSPPPFTTREECVKSINGHPSSFLRPEPGAPDSEDYPKNMTEHEWVFTSMLIDEIEGIPFDENRYPKKCKADHDHEEYFCLQSDTDMVDKFLTTCATNKPEAAGPVEAQQMTFTELASHLTTRNQSTDTQPRHATPSGDNAPAAPQKRKRPTETTTPVKRQRSSNGGQRPPPLQLGSKVGQDIPAALRDAALHIKSLPRDEQSGLPARQSLKSAAPQLHAYINKASGRLRAGNNELLDFYGDTRLFAYKMWQYLKEWTADHKKRDWSLDPLPNDCSATNTSPAALLVTPQTEPISTPPPISRADTQTPGRTVQSFETFSPLQDLRPRTPGVAQTAQRSDGAMQKVVKNGSTQEPASKELRLPMPSKQQQMAQSIRAQAPMANIHSPMSSQSPSGPEYTQMPTTPSSRQRWLPPQNSNQGQQTVDALVRLQAQYHQQMELNKMKADLAAHRLQEARAAMQSNSQLQLQPQQHTNGNAMSPSRVTGLQQGMSSSAQPALARPHATQGGGITAPDLRRLVSDQDVQSLRRRFPQAACLSDDQIRVQAYRSQLQRRRLSTMPGQPPKAQQVAHAMPSPRRQPGTPSQNTPSRATNRTPVQMPGPSRSMPRLSEALPQSRMQVMNSAQQIHQNMRRHTQAPAMPLQHSQQTNAVSYVDLTTPTPSPQQTPQLMAPQPAPPMAGFIDPRALLQRPYTAMRQPTPSTAHTSRLQTHSPAFMTPTMTMSHLVGLTPMSPMVPMTPTTAQTPAVYGPQGMQLKSTPQVQQPAIQIQPWDDFTTGMEIGQQPDLWLPHLGQEQQESTTGAMSKEALEALFEN